MIDSGESPEERAMAAMRSIYINKAMAGLTLKHRAVIELAFVQEMSYAEIAEILDCPVGTVKSRMSYALRQLSQSLLNTGFNPREEAGKEK
jgi:RNA polymerase sigma-70 factor (ECF subfamily)